MRHLRNSLYIFTEDAYLTVDGENVVAKSKEKEIGRIPLHTIENIFCFSYPGASPKLMGKCAESGIALSFLVREGNFLLVLVGKIRAIFYCVESCTDMLMMRHGVLRPLSNLF